MTEKLYLTDAYLKEIESELTYINGNEIKVKEDIFYPESGGQPADSGKIIYNDQEFEVKEIRKEGEDIVLVLNNPINAKVGEKVKEIIDWDKRYSHMRLHTAIHIIDGVLFRDYNSAMITGSQIYDDKARFDINYPDFSKEFAQELIEKANKIVEEGHEVKVEFLPKDEVLNRNMVRTKPGMELIKSMDIVRVIEIVGLDAQMDGGTHVKNTKEVGKIILDKVENKGKENKRLYIRLTNN